MTGTPRNLSAQTKWYNEYNNENKTSGGGGHARDASRLVGDVVGAVHAMCGAMIPA